MNMALLSPRTSP